MASASIYLCVLIVFQGGQEYMVLIVNIIVSLITFTLDYYRECIDM